jgi:DNA polymerase I
MKTLLLIDANSLIHRSYHALPPLTTPEGEPIGAIYGLASMLLKITREDKPDYIAAAFDRPEPTFREGLFKDYKAHRPKTDEELVNQLAEAQNLLQKFNIPYFEKAGVEADDVIAALVKKFEGKKNLKIMILTGDLDTLQLVRGDKIVVKTPQKGVSKTIIYDELKVKERYGLEPQKLNDYKGLVGDKSDNIPGVPGVGPKTASKVLQEFGSLEDLYKNLKEPKNKMEEKLLEHKESAFFSKKLATLQPDIELETNLENLTFNLSDNGALFQYFNELGFQSLAGRLSPNAADSSAPPPVGKNVVFITGPDDFLINKKMLESKKIKVALDWKPIFKELKERGLVPAPPIFDIKIAEWLTNPDRKKFTAVENKEALVGLYGFLNEKLDEYELRSVFEKIEMPLIEVIAAMESWGIGVDASTLKTLSKEINSELEGLTKKIYKEAKTTFNINSASQVASVLFEKLGLEGPGAKTATGRRSTSQDVLKEMKDKHPIVGLILDYRENSKIESTFVRPLIDAVGLDGRVHTTYLQTGTATGRLASENPNLQNLPQESKWSKKLRNAFTASPKSSFLALDYSQLELRLLAHVSGDEKLKKAFWEGADAHKITAAQIFNVSVEKVTPEMRRLGKTLNFGVVYGMGPRAFAATAGIDFERAKEFIEEYFNNFPAVKDWQDKTKSEAAMSGFVKNENGRRRWFSPESRPDEIERAAINMPIQSLGADILKLAMIESFQNLRSKNWLGADAKPLLTIHDELLFEVRDDILKSVSGFIKETMENVYKISVPLRVEVKIGKNLGNLNEEDKTDL